MDPYQWVRSISALLRETRSGVPRRIGGSTLDTTRTQPPCNAMRFQPTSKWGIWTLPLGLPRERGALGWHTRGSQSPKGKRNMYTMSRWGRRGTGHAAPGCRCVWHGLCMWRWGVHPSPQHFGGIRRPQTGALGLELGSGGGGSLRNCARAHTQSCSVQYSTIQTVSAHLEYLPEQSSDPAAQTAAQTRTRH